MSRGPTYHVHVDETATVFPVTSTVRVAGIQLISGTSVTLYEGASAAGDPLVIANTVGLMVELPGCVEVKGLHAVSDSNGAATIFYS